MEIRFTLNGTEVRAGGIDPHTPLLHFLRDQGHTGTKEGCAEGECGACAVVIVRKGPDGKTRYVPVNSCLVLLPAVHGAEVVSVEGIRDEALHPVQQAMVDTGGSQCGYCTPGFVVSLFAEFYRAERTPGEVDPEAISGNLCRCTGYRPIRDALASLGSPEADDRHLVRLQRKAPERRPFAYECGESRFERPTSLDALFTLLNTHPKAKLIAGGTDLVVEVNQRDARWDVLIGLDAIPELRGIDDEPSHIRIGAAVPLSEVEEVLHGHSAILDELFPLFSSRLIRNRATFGGNIVNASPIGDGPPALLALDAAVEVSSRDGQRAIPLADFFTGYRKTVLEHGEVVSAVRIPKPLPNLQRFFKVSKRILDDISTVAAGFGLWTDDAGIVTKARLAYGGVAATPVRALDAENALVGQPFDAAAVARVRPLLENAFTPISDHRGSAAYRRAMVPRLIEKLEAERAEAAE